MDYTKANKQYESPTIFHGETIRECLVDFMVTFSIQKITY